MGPKVRAHDKVLAFEKPPSKQRQSDRAPIIDGEFSPHPLDQVTEQRQERSLDGEGRGPRDTEERIDDRQGVEQRRQLAGRDDDARARRGGLIHEYDVVRVHHQTRPRAEAYQREQDE